MSRRVPVEGKPFQSVVAWPWYVAVVGMILTVIVWTTIIVVAVIAVVWLYLALCLRYAWVCWRRRRVRGG